MGYVPQWPYVFGQIGMGKQCRHRSDCSYRSSLIRVVTVCYSICTILTKSLRFCLFVWILGRLQQRFLASRNLGSLRVSAIILKSLPLAQCKHKFMINLKAPNTTIAELNKHCNSRCDGSNEPFHLIYNVCPLIFNFSTQCSLFWKFFEIWQTYFCRLLFCRFTGTNTMPYF